MPPFNEGFCAVRNVTVKCYGGFDLYSFLPNEHWTLHLGLFLTTNS